MSLLGNNSVQDPSTGKSFGTFRKRTAFVFVVRSPRVSLAEL